MIGKLYSIKYIEEHFPWAVQKYKDKDGYPAEALYGIPVNEASKIFFGDVSTQLKVLFTVIPCINTKSAM